MGHEWIWLCVMLAVMVVAGSLAVQSLVDVIRELRHTAEAKRRLEEVPGPPRTDASMEAEVLQILEDLSAPERLILATSDLELERLCAIQRWQAYCQVRRAVLLRSYGQPRSPRGVHADLQAEEIWA